jgi:uncharacterized SAM-binding protein YcdF (DUF218 family)
MTSVRFRKLLTTVILFGVVAVLTSNNTVWQSAGDFLVLRDNLNNADLIVVMGGDFYGPRVDRAAGLVAAGYAKRVLISGPPYGNPPRPEGEWAIERLQQRGYSPELFDSFGHHATNTPSEVVALCTELIRRHAKSIILVTDGYHSRRSAVTFAVICPEISIISAPAKDNKFNTLQWWTRDRDRMLAKSEWEKLVGTVLLAPRYWIMRM